MPWYYRRVVGPGRALRSDLRWWVTGIEQRLTVGPIVNEFRRTLFALYVQEAI